MELKLKVPVDSKLGDLGYKKSATQPFRKGSLSLTFIHSVVHFLQQIHSDSVIFFVKHIPFQDGVFLFRKSYLQVSYLFSLVIYGVLFLFCLFFLHRLKLLIAVNVCFVCHWLDYWKILMRFVLFLFSSINLYSTLFNALRKYLVLLYSRSTNLTKVMTGVSLVPVITPVLCTRQSLLVCEKPAVKVTYIIADTMTPQMKSLSRFPESKPNRFPPNNLKESFPNTHR